jgi:hypothetical protein
MNTEDNIAVGYALQAANLGKESDPRAFIQGQPDKADLTIIDGRFNLIDVAREILSQLSATGSKTE